MKFELVDSITYQRRDRARVALNDEARRVARIRAKDEGTVFDEDKFEPPEPEPDGVFNVGGTRFMLVTREKGDPPYNAEQMAEQVRLRCGQFRDSDAPRGAVNV